MAITSATGRQLADQIRNWLEFSGQPEPSGALAEFVDALETNSNIGVWAGVDFERILPLRIPEDRSARQLALWRNILIFLPLVVTWISLSLAARDFAKETSEVNFLKFWHDMPGFNLAVVAIVDIVIFALIILLTLAVGNRENSDTRRMEYEEQHVDLMVCLERDLSGYRYLSLKDLNDAASNTLNSLQTSTQEIQVAAAAFADTAVRAHDAIIGANDAVVTNFTPAVQRLEQVLQGVDTAVTAHSGMSQMVQNAQAALSQQVAAMSKGLADAVTALRTEMGQMTSAVESQLAGASNGVSTAMNTAINNINHVSSQAAGQLSSGVLQRLDAVADQLSGVGREMKDIVADLNRATSNMSVNSATLRDDFEEIHRILRDVLDAGRR